MATKVTTSLKEELESNASYTDSVGNRTWHKRMPQRSALPAVVISRISHPRDHTHDGPSGIATPRIQVDVYADTYDTVLDVSETMRSILDGFTGNLGVNTLTPVERCYLVDVDEPDIQRDEDKHHRVRNDFVLSIQED